MKKMAHLRRLRRRLMTRLKVEWRIILGSEATGLPGELLGKSGNRGANLDADHRLREHLDVLARSSMCHPGHQSNTCPANYSLFNLSCGLINKQQRRLWERSIHEGEYWTGAWLVWRSCGGSQNSSLKVISQMLEDSNQYKYRDYNFCIFVFNLQRVSCLKSVLGLWN